MILSKYNYREPSTTEMNTNHHPLNNDFQFFPNIDTNVSELNPNAAVFVPRWLQPPPPVRQNGTIWLYANDLIPIMQTFPDNSKRHMIISTQPFVTEDLCSIMQKLPDNSKRQRIISTQPFVTENVV
jgi:hypothetical protein